MRSDQAKTIAIDQYLERVEGIKPAKVSQGGREIWYSSPLRQGDSSPSFKVDTILNLWYDHGLARGGKIIDLVCEIRAISVREALAVLENSGLYAGGFSRSDYPIKHTSATALFSEKKTAGEKEKSHHEKSHQLIAEKTLSHPALLEYLQDRKIDLDIAKQYLKEIHFKPADKLIQYYAVGWKNGEGYEARNKYFKGFIGTGKTLSVIHPIDKNEVLVFEGFMDFLAYLTYLKQEKGITTLKASAVILNSTALRKQLLDLMAKYQFSKLYFFLDNDASGQDTLDYYQQTFEGLELVDMSDLYAGFKDVNDMLINQV